jgi:hypothetical protein
MPRLEAMPTRIKMPRLLLLSQNHVSPPTHLRLQERQSPGPPPIPKTLTTGPLSVLPMTPSPNPPPSSPPHPLSLYPPSLLLTSYPDPQILHRLSPLPYRPKLHLRILSPQQRNPIYTLRLPRVIGIPTRPPHLHLPPWLRPRAPLLWAIERAVWPEMDHGRHFLLVYSIHDGLRAGAELGEFSGL